jgi:hypothetical protein
LLRLTVLSADAEVPLLPDTADGHVKVWEEQGQVCSYTYTSAEHHWMHVPRVGTFRFRTGATSVVAIPLESADHGTVTEAFVRTVLPTALQALGREILHASAVLTPAGVVAFSGNSGAGKSTLAYLMSRRGHRAWADDAVMFERTADGMKALPLPFRINLRRDATLFFGKPPVEASEARPAPLVAVIFLARHQEQPSSFAARRLSSAEAFKAVLTQAYCFDPHDRERNGRTGSAYLELAARVPIFEIRFASGFEHSDRLAEQIEELVREAL